MFPTSQCTAKHLYGQMQYFSALFDLPRARKKMAEENKKRMALLFKARAKAARQSAKAGNTSAVDAVENQTKSGGQYAVVEDTLPKAGSNLYYNLENLCGTVNDHIQDSNYHWVKPTLWRSVFGET